MSSARQPRQEDKDKDDECATRRNKDKGESKGDISQIKQNNETNKQREKDGDALAALK